MNKVYWFTGLSGAGKTTIGRLWYEKLKVAGENIVFLDGDELREAIADDLRFSKSDRRKSGMRNAKLCALLARQGVTVVCCTISMFDSIREWNRKNIPGYFEVYMKVSMETLHQRDQKNLYTQEKNNVAGIHFEVEEPKCPDLVLENDGQRTPEEQIEILWNAHTGKEAICLKLGDFTKLAKDYVHRTGYSETVLHVVRSYLESINGVVQKVADVGAGTGKLTQDLESIGLHGYAVEPNDAMRAEGIKLFEGKDTFLWSEGSAEQTGLPENSVDWVLMGSSFHWADAPVALKEFHRILKPNGFFTAIWNPRNVESSPFHMEIENTIREMVPNLKRVSSGSRANMQDMEKKLLSTEFFTDLFLVEAPHQAVMSKERYMGAWRSVNDIHVQAGDELFEKILNMIEGKISGMDKVIVPYLSRAFTVRSTKR